MDIRILKYARTIGAIKCLGDQDVTQVSASLFFFAFRALTMLTWGLRKSRSAAEPCEEVVSTYIQNCQLFVYSEVVSSTYRIGNCLCTAKSSRLTYRVANCLCTREPFWGPKKKVYSPSLLLLFLLLWAN